METNKPLRVKFKLESQVIEELIETIWTIGKIKGKIRKSFKINPYYSLEFLYNGKVLENSRQFREIDYEIGAIIKVMASRASEV